jgi:tRNA U34 5-carboxymethylaminomethyl modifying GTPase MnmE/TrmE
MVALPMKYVLALIFIFSLHHGAYAQEPNYQSMNKEGFAGVARLLESMTPQQRDAILKQAQASMGDLEKMSPQERQKLVEQMKQIAATIDFDKVDPAKIDPSKATGVSGDQKNFNTYQKKHKKGLIKNGVVINPPSTAGR